MPQAPVSHRIVVCPYCRGKAIFVSSEEVYGGRFYGMIWLCRACAAWVGVHKGSDRPLGRLADRDLRDWKTRAHNAFDPLWQDRRGVDRNQAYKWLANQMNLSTEDCHIGRMNVEQCKRVVEICSQQGGIKL